MHSLGVHRTVFDHVYPQIFGCMTSFDRFWFATDTRPRCYWQISWGGGGGGGVHNPTHKHTHTQDLHRRTVCHAAGDIRGPPCHEGKPGSCLDYDRQLSENLASRKSGTTMHLRASHISVKTIQLENYNCSWKQKKEKELFIVWLDRQKQTIRTSGNFPYDFSQCYLLVSLKSEVASFV